MTATAAIVLAGGRSARMGAPKASLEWHGSTLLRRVAGTAGRAAGPVIVVRAPGQVLPALPAGVRVVEDAVDGRGPLEGVLAGLLALPPAAEVVYLTATDVPLLHPAFVTRVLAGVGPDDEAAAALVDGRWHPLAAAYRARGLADLVEALLAAGRRRATDLLEGRRVAWLDAPALLADAGLAAVDPALDSLRNLNGPDDYAAARALPAPAVTVVRGGGAPVTVRAATLAAAGAGAGAAVNGHPVPSDPEWPLAAGDVVTVPG